MRNLVFAAILLLGLPCMASAQCTDGRVSTEQTAGRCCWPGQSWNVALGRCEGPPTCPAGWSAEGDSCLQRGGAATLTPPPGGAPPGTAAAGAAPAGGADQAPPPDGYPPAQAYAPPGYGAPAQPQYGAQAYAPQQGWAQRPPVAMHEEQRSIRGLIITGIIMLGAGYIYSAIMGGIFVDESGCGVRNAGWMFVPVIGGFVWGAVDSEGCGWDSSTGEAIGIPGAGVQTIGLSLLVIGILVKRTVMVPDSQASLVPQLTPGPGEVGLGLTWRF